MIENTKHSVSSATNIYIHTKITATPIKQQQKNPAGIKILLCYHFSHSAPQYSMRRLNPKNSKESMADEKRATTRTHITTKPFKLHSKQPKKRTNLIPTIYIYIYIYPPTLLASSGWEQSEQPNTLYLSSCLPYTNYHYHILFTNIPYTI